MKGSNTFRVFDTKDMLAGLGQELVSITNMSISDFEIMMASQIFNGNQLPLNMEKLLTKGFFSRYCEYVMYRFNAAITGGALFEFAVLRTLQAYFGESFQYQIQKKVNIRGRKRTYSKIDLALIKDGNVQSLVELKREMDTSLDDLDDYLRNIAIENNIPKTYAVIYACYIAEAKLSIPDNMLIDHLCAVGDSWKSYGEAFRMSIANNDEKPDYNSIYRLNDHFIENLFDRIRC